MYENLNWLYRFMFGVLTIDSFKVEDKKSERVTITQ